MQTSRRDFIGGSDIAAIIGVSPWKDLYTLWLEKTGRKEPDAVNPYMQWGIDHEDMAREAFIRESKIVVSKPSDSIAHEKYDYCRASLDGITFDGEIIYEGKCPTGNKTMELAKAGKIEDHYMAQIQWYLMITKAQKAMFHVWKGNEKWKEEEQVIIEVLPNKEFQAQLLDAAIKFWDLVKNDIEPEKPEDKYLAIETPTFIALSEKWKQVNAKLKQVQKEEKEAKEALLAETDGGNCKGNGLIISLVESKCTDWEIVCATYGLTEDKIKPFQKIKAAYQKISLDKTCEKSKLAI